MIGQQVGSYLIESQIGEGGMGAVYRATHVMLRRPAAIKVLLPQFSVNADFVQRFFNEAKAATSIRHLGIVEIYDFGLNPGGVAYIAMELLRGESLARRMKRGRLPVHASLGIIRQMCGALGAAHELGIVHRDLKPDNVFIVPDGEVATGERIKLLDFGIAKLTQDSGGMSSHKTRTGALMGTPTYMAPEQCRGVHVDHRADIYSLGCMLYELVAGRPPFVGEGVGDVLAAHIDKQPKPVTEYAATPPGLDILLAQVLAKDPAHRPQSTQDIIRAIDQIAASRSEGSSAAMPGYGATATPTTLSGSAASTKPPAAEPRRRRRTTFAIAGVIAVGLAIAVTTALVHTPDDERAPRVASNTAGTLDAGMAGLDASAAQLDAGLEPPNAPTIRVKIYSAPSGSRVVRDGVDLGKTPYAGEFARVDGTLAFTLRHDGFKDRRVEVSAAHDAERLETLERNAAPRNTGSPVVSRARQSWVMPESPPVAPAVEPKLGEDDAVNPLRRKAQPK